MQETFRKIQEKMPQEVKVVVLHDVIRTTERERGEVREMAKHIDEVITMHMYGVNPLNCLARVMPTRR